MMLKTMQKPTVAGKAGRRSSVRVHAAAAPVATQLVTKRSEEVRARGALGDARWM